MDHVLIRGARQHHLKNLTVAIPKGKLTVITGPSGSGKSSLAFDTLYAEGQRRYVESLSVYARQFLSQLEKPDVDSIEGLNPAIAIEQRVGGLSPRSTVASATEIYDYLRILWAAAGVPHDPETGERMTRMGPSEIITELAAQPEGSKLIILAAVPEEETAEPERLLGDLQRQGFIRIRIDGEIKEITEVTFPENTTPKVEIVIDRLVIREGIEARLADSIELALRICGAEARVLLMPPGEKRLPRAHLPNLLPQPPHRRDLRRPLTPPLLLQHPRRRMPGMRRPRLQSLQPPPPEKGNPSRQESKAPPKTGSASWNSASSASKKRAAGSRF